MRAPVDTIAAPPFLPQLRWLNLPDGVKRLRMDQLVGRPVLIEFWDFCRPNSLRTLPYLQGWHQRYATTDPESGQASGLQVIGIHSPGFEPARERESVIKAVSRLSVTYPVLLDRDLEMWRVYENLGWPARYLFDCRSRLHHYHYGEGAYEETELAIQELLELADPPQPLAPVRPEDAPSAQLLPQTMDVEGPYSGPYEAGGVWAVLHGSGTVTASVSDPEGQASDVKKTFTVTHPGAYLLVEHERHMTATLKLELDEGVRCLATCFTPGLA